MLYLYKNGPAIGRWAGKRFKYRNIVSGSSSAAYYRLRWVSVVEKRKVRQAAKIIRHLFFNDKNLN